MPAAAWCNVRYGDELILVMPLVTRPARGRRPEQEHYQPGHDLGSEFCRCGPRVSREPGAHSALLVHNDLDLVRLDYP